MPHLQGADMPDLIKTLQSVMESDAANSKLIGDALLEIAELRKKTDALEEILIVLARTQLPWDDDGNPTEGLSHFRERYLNAMHEASDLLGLDLRSTITRIEPRN
jgi:hypothetical protein